jgi:hypothetical protein
VAANPSQTAAWMFYRTYVFRVCMIALFPRGVDCEAACVSVRVIEQVGQEKVGKARLMWRGQSGPAIDCSPIMIGS